MDCCEGSVMPEHVARVVVTVHVPTLAPALGAAPGMTFTSVSPADGVSVQVRLEEVLEPVLVSVTR